MPDHNESDVKTDRYDVSFGDTPVVLGYIQEEPEPEIDIATQDIKTSQTYDQVLGRWVTGFSCEFDVILKECTLERLVVAFPHFSDTLGTDPIPLVPATLGVDEYQYGEKLILHPRSKGSDTKEDYVFSKAVPRFGKVANTAEGRVIVIHFVIYPDRAQLPSIVIGYIGQ